jgi:hypothetical protein
MVKVDNEPELTEDLEARPEEERLKGTLDETDASLRDGVESLLGELGQRNDVDRDQLTGLGRELRDRASVLGHTFGQLELAGIDRDLLQQLHDALRPDGDLGRLDERLDAATSEARRTLDQQLDTGASREQFDTQLYERAQARHQMEGLDQARELLQKVEASQRLTRQLDELRNNLARMSAEDVVRTIRASVDEAARAEHDEERRKRISMELTDGEVEI